MISGGLFPSDVTVENIVRVVGHSNRQEQHKNVKDNKDRSEDEVADVVHTLFLVFLAPADGIAIGTGAPRAGLALRLGIALQLLGGSVIAMITIYIQIVK